MRASDDFYMNRIRILIGASLGSGIVIVLFLIYLSVRSILSSTVLVLTSCSGLSAQVLSILYQPSCCVGGQVRSAVGGGGGYPQIIKMWTDPHYIQSKHLDSIEPHLGPYRECGKMNKCCISRFKVVWRSNEQMLQKGRGQKLRRNISFQSGLLNPKCLHCLISGTSGNVSDLLKPLFLTLEPPKCLN